MAASADMLTLKIANSSTGDLVAEVKASAGSKVEELGPEVALAMHASKWTEFRFLHGSRALEKTEVLGSLQPGATEVELSMLKLPRLSIRCPSKVLAAAALPCQDLFVVTRGNASSKKDEELATLGRDYGVRSPFWLWRVKAADGWSFDSATLLARSWPVVNVAAVKEWLARRLESQLREETCKEEEAAGSFLEESILTDAEKEEWKRKGTVDFFPSRWQEFALVSVAVYSDDCAVLAWNQNDYLGGMAVIERLNLQTGKIVQWGSAYDVWDVAADPTTGTIFVTTCYDGQDIIALGSECNLTESEDKEVTLGKKDLYIKSQAVGLGFGFCLDSVLGVLVAASQERSADFFVVGPADAPGMEFAKMAPGASVVDSIRPAGDDHTPGDKTHAWETVKIPAPDGAPALYAPSALSCVNGVVRYLSGKDTKRELRVSKLFGPSSAENEVIRCAEHELLETVVVMPDGITAVFITTP